MARQRDLTRLHCFKDSAVRLAPVCAVAETAASQVRRKLRKTVLQLIGPDQLVYKMIYGFGPESILDYPVYEVAEAVGYSNINYFHNKFKKNTGFSPMAYKKQFGHGE